MSNDIPDKNILYKSPPEADSLRKWVNSMSSDQMGEMLGNDPVEDVIKAKQRIENERIHTIVAIKSAEMSVDTLAIKLRTVPNKDAELTRILGLLHKASSHLYCAHSVMLETPKSWMANV